MWHTRKARTGWDIRKRGGQGRKKFCKCCPPLWRLEVPRDASLPSPYPQQMALMLPVPPRPQPSKEPPRSWARRGSVAGISKKAAGSNPSTARVSRDWRGHHEKGVSHPVSNSPRKSDALPVPASLVGLG